MGEYWKLLMSMLGAVYADTVEEKAICDIRPKPAFRALFEMATTREGIDDVCYSSQPPDLDGQGAEPCFWWRRGRVELPVQKNPRRDRYRLS